MAATIAFCVINSQRADIGVGRDEDAVPLSGWQHAFGFNLVQQLLSDTVAEHVSRDLIEHLGHPVFVL
ncbi:hypothetical protein [Pseudomonas sp. WPR_5_2]|uniref:hypothetical protein n=1 Tax=Pseudomonas sp. WPR_5_2 TaxID=1907371 RepID=UPI0015AF6D7A|nr:hypothetical protein [Pseudomonas sp. WPR_5_2]